MDKRQQELRKIQEYIEVVDKETTLLLQSLQWDSKHLLESPAMVTCKFVSDHKTPLRSQEAHEKRCYLAHLGYSQQEVLLPDVIDPNAETVVKLNHQDIMNIINTAAASDPAFKRGVGSVGTEPLSLSRLQLAYSADERRAIHDAVVAAAPPDQELTDLDLPSSSSSGRRTTAKSAAEMLAELRDMKRRRARYRVAANTTRYSDVLRDVIKTQMELYAEAKGIFIKTEYGPKSYVSLQDKSTENDVTDIVIKQERISPDRDNNKERSRRYKERSRSRDRRRRMEHKDRETSSRKRHHFNEEDNSSHNRRRDNSNQGRYSKERNNDESHSKRYKYNKNLSEHKYDDRYQRAESRSQKYYERSEDRRKSKYNDSSYDSSKTSKYDKSSKEYDKHSNHRDNSSNGSKSDYKRKHDEYEKHTHFNVYREHKHREYDRIKKEKVDYDDD